MNRKKPRSTHKLVVRILAILLALMFVLTLASQIFFYAWAVDPAELEKLDALQVQQSQLEAQEADYTAALETLSSEEGSLVEQCFLLEEQSRNLADQIETTEAMLEQYAADIKETCLHIEQAQEEYDRFHELFADRLLQLQKTGASHSVLDLIFSSDSMSEFFNALRSYRLLAQKDQEIMDTMDALQTTLTAEEEELERQQTAEEAQLDKLSREKDALNDRDKEYQAALKQLRKNKDKYAADIKALRKQHSDITLAIEDEEALIRSLEEAEQQGILEMVGDEPVVTISEEKNEDETALVEEAPAEEPAAEEKAQPEKASTEAEAEKPESDAASDKETAPEEEEEPAPSVSSSEVISYAMQFLGNPYVWGGNSLTQGCDCSGFVREVYRHFGITGFPRTSDAIRNCSVGYKVSVSDLEPGDLVCYSGHIGLYIGGGKMINALNERYGIVISSIYRVGKNPICGRRVL